MKTGFTLIELLIVVAIIGILAAIATMNMRDAQIRARVAQSYSNLKAFDTAIQQFILDKGVMLVDLGDGLQDWGADRINTVFHGVGQGTFPQRNRISVFTPLTSPTPYLTHLPEDPFYPEYVKSAHEEFLQENQNKLPMNYYTYKDYDTSEKYGIPPPLFRRHEIGTRGNIRGIEIKLEKGGYYIWGLGPKLTYKTLNGKAPFYSTSITTYNTTNGIVSRGIMILVSGEGILQ